MEINDNFLDGMLDAHETLDRILTRPHDKNTLGNIESAANTILKFVQMQKLLEIMDEFCNKKPMRIVWAYEVDDSGISIDLDRVHAYGSDGNEIIVHKISSHGENIEDQFLDLDIYFIYAEGWFSMAYDNNLNIWYMDI